MVSQTRRSPDTSHRRILTAAEEEFAAWGFDGARVDRIAERAGLNKAMLYYHFQDKAALYQAILSGLFRTLADAIEGNARPGGAPETRIREFIGTIAAATAERPHFPAIWLREMAEGGRHLNASIGADLARILGALGRILDDGRDAGRFGAAHPLITQMGIVAPLLLFTASATARLRLGRQIGKDVGTIPREAVVEYVERATLAALAASPGERTGRTRAAARRREA